MLKYFTILAVLLKSWLELQDLVYSMKLIKEMDGQIIIVFIMLKKHYATQRKIRKRNLQLHVFKEVP